MRYYEDVAGQELAEDFYDEFRRLVEDAGNRPELFTDRPGGFKRANLKRFPYNFLFKVRDDGIRILVVRHHARQPSYGTSRK